MNEYMRVCRFRVGRSEACLCVRLVIVARSRWARSTFVLRAARFVDSILSVCGGYGLCATHVLIVVRRVVTSTTGFVLACATAFLLHEHADLTVVSSLLSHPPSPGGLTARRYHVWLWPHSYRP